MLENTGKDSIPEDQLLRRVIFGLYPSIQSIVSKRKITTLHDLFCFADILDEVLPRSDPFWSSSECTQYEPPDLTITVSNESATISADVLCYRCGEHGHYARHCWNPRNSKLKPKLSKKKRKKPGKKSCVKMVSQNM